MLDVNICKWEGKKGQATWIQRQTEGRKSILTICEHWGFHRSGVGCKKKPLPPCIREAKTLASFKKAWKQFLILEGEVYRIDYNHSLLS